MKTYCNIQNSTFFPVWMHSDECIIMTATFASVALQTHFLWKIPVLVACLQLELSPEIFTVHSKKKIM